jgi:hypothetical protein
MLEDNTSLEGFPSEKAGKSNEIKVVFLKTKRLEESSQISAWRTR